MLLDAFGRMAEASNWLTLGRVYHVMGINIASDGKKFYQIVTHEKPGEWPNVGYYDSRCFEVLTNFAPSNWRVSVNRDSILIGPEAWLGHAFLEAFHDHSPLTMRIFERECEIILQEDP
jgi:hypothetical protein